MNYTFTTHTDAGHINGYDPACEACNSPAPHHHECPGCGLIMSVREAAEQGECNECHPGGAYDPRSGAW